MLKISRCVSCQLGRFFALPANLGSPADRSVMFFYKAPSFVPAAAWPLVFISRWRAGVAFKLESGDGLPLPPSSVPRSFLCAKYSKLVGLREMKGSGRGGAAKMERKAVEKNRRMHMKSLCMKLSSLIPKEYYSNPKVHRILCFLLLWSLCIQFYCLRVSWQLSSLAISWRWIRFWCSRVLLSTFALDLSPRRNLTRILVFFSYVFPISHELAVSGDSIFFWLFFLRFSSSLWAPVFI